MNSSVRSTVKLALGALPLLVAAGCGGTDGQSASGAQLTPIQGTSYVTIEPATTTTTLPAAETTAPAGGSISAEPQSYTVQAGDSLSKIANMYGVTVQDIIDYNQYSGTDQLLLPGQTVVGIPPGAKVPGTGTVADPAVDPSTQEGSVDPATVTTVGVGCTYTIVANDNPSKVAGKFGISIDALQGANADSNVMQTFIVGQTLKIPAGADCSAAG